MGDRNRHANEPEGRRFPGGIDVVQRLKEEDSSPVFDNRTLGCLPARPVPSIAPHEQCVWAAAQNQFFALAAMPA
jgi:hypothetical protein